LLNLYLRMAIGDHNLENLEEIHARQEFESARRIMVMDPEHGFEGIRAHQQVNLENMTDSSLKMISKGNDPILLLPELDGADMELSLIIKTEITSPDDTRLQFYWITPENEGRCYAEWNSASKKLRMGRNVVLIKIPPNQFKAPLRLDPGDIQGIFILHSIEIRLINK